MRVLIYLIRARLSSELEVAQVEGAAYAAASGRSAGAAKAFWTTHQVYALRRTSSSQQSLMEMLGGMRKRSSSVELMMQ